MSRTPDFSHLVEQDLVGYFRTYCGMTEGEAKTEAARQMVEVKKIASEFEPGNDSE